MKICGIVKTTLIDYPGKVACVIFLEGCNFRCGFCHNPELVLLDSEEHKKIENKEISEKEFFDFLEKRRNQLEGVCITGGEPLLTLKEEFLRKIKQKGFLIKLDTNGSFPSRLKEFIDKKLIDYVAMDVKSSKEKYQEVTNSKIDVSKIEDSIKIIMSSFSDKKIQGYEFRTTIVKKYHNKEEMKKIGEWLSSLSKEVGVNKPKILSLQGFKNKGKLINEEFKKEKDVFEEYLLEIQDEIKDFFEEVEVRV